MDELIIVLLLPLVCNHRLGWVQDDLSSDELNRMIQANRIRTYGGSKQVLWKNSLNAR